MKIVVRTGPEELDLGLDPQDDRLLGYWDGSGAAGAFDPREFGRAIAAPRDFPPLAQAVVPGDRVAVALDLPAGMVPGVIGELAKELAAADVAEFLVVSNAQTPPHELPAGVTWQVHDPDDRTGIAYLSTTKDGQRVYLNRALVDADFVLPIGLLGYDRSLGYRGPWSALYPGLSDRETQTRFRRLAAPDPAARDQEPPAGLAESSEVGWLIGCQLEVGIVSGGSESKAAVIAGLESVVRAEGIAAVERAGTFRVAERADVVVVGVGLAGEPTTIDEIGGALEVATRLVRRGGKVVALAHWEGPVGPTVRRLAGVENPKAALNRLRGHEAEPDYLAATQIATTLAWADVYLHSRLDADLVEDLAIIPLGRLEEARKLARTAASLIVINGAERTRCVVADEN